MDDPDPNRAAPVTPLDALQVMASSEVMVGPGLRHVELYTMRGLLTLLWHEPPDDVAVAPGALVLCGGAMGGLLGPGDALYHRLGVEWSARGVAVLFIWLGLLAAIGLAGASYLSFPVAAFFSITMLIVGLSSGTIAQHFNSLNGSNGNGIQIGTHRSSTYRSVDVH